MATAEVVVKQDEIEVVPAEVLATAITKVCAGLSAWNKAGLRRRALIVLLADSTRLSKTTVQTVLDGILKLQDIYFLPPPQPPTKKK